MSKHSLTKKWDMDPTNRILLVILLLPFEFLHQKRVLKNSNLDRSEGDGSVKESDLEKSETKVKK